MNQTRILLGVILLLLAIFGFMTWNHQNEMKAQQKNQQELIAKLLSDKNAVTPAPAAPKQDVAPVADSEKPTTGMTPEQQRLDALAKEVAAMKEENATLKLRGAADAEEKERLSGELDRTKFEIDQRLQRIRNAPMLAKVIKVLPDQGFVVISAGRSTGIDVDDEFSIRRGDKIICQIRIGESIDEQEAVADPVPGTMAPQENIAEGDQVVKID